MNKLISICIPTYNRASILREGLEYLIPLVERWNVAIIISDNASTDDTSNVVSQAKLRYDHIFYHRNERNIGMDCNFESVLRLATTEYAWLLGDDDRIHHEALKKVLDRLTAESSDLLLLNGGSSDASRGRVTGRHAQVYINQDAFLHDLGWHVTWISGLVISTSLIAMLNFKKYQDSYFSHFGSLFDALSKQRTIKILWEDSSCYYPSSLAEFSWAQRALEIFAEKWSQVVLSLPETYSPEAKKECILAHSRHTHIFSIMGLLNLRAQGAISRTKIRQYSRSLALVTDADLRLALLISSIPILMLKHLRNLYIVLRNLKVSASSEVHQSSSLNSSNN